MFLLNIKIFSCSDVFLTYFKLKAWTLHILKKKKINEISEKFQQIWENDFQAIQITTDVSTKKNVKMQILIEEQLYTLQTIFYNITINEKKNLIDG